MIRKLLAVLFLTGSVYGAATPIANLAISTDANGRGNSWTNLADVVLTNGVRLSTVSGGGGSGSPLVAESNIVLRTAGGTNYVALPTTISNGITFVGAINASDNIEIANTKHLRFQDGGGTNTVHLAATAGRLIVSGAVDIVTGQAVPLTVNGSAVATGTPLYVQSQTNANARLASNVWAAANSTTNFAPLLNGRMKPIYGAGTFVEDGGHAIINTMTTRTDFRSTNRGYSVLGLYAGNGTGMLTGSVQGMDLWNYGQNHNIPYAAGTRSPYIGLGLHGSTSAVIAASFWTEARGTNDRAHDLIFGKFDAFDGQSPNMVLQHEGHLIVSGQVRSTAGFIGNGASITNPPNWTNFVLSTGGSYTSASTWDFFAPNGLDFMSVGNGAFSVSVVSSGAVLQWTGTKWEFAGGPINGNGSEIVDIPLTGLRITNTASAGQVLATSNGTNGYWTTISGGGGSGAPQSPWTNTISGAGNSLTNVQNLAASGIVDAVYFKSPSNFQFNANGQVLTWP